MNEQEQTDSNSSMAFVTGLFAGAVIGAGLGLLFAPRKGSELRGQLSDAATNVSKTVSKAADDYVERGRQVYDRARDIASRAGEQVEHVAGVAAKGVDEGLDAVRDGAERGWQAGYRS